VLATALRLAIAWPQETGGGVTAIRRAIVKNVAHMVQWGADEKHHHAADNPVATPLTDESTASWRRQDRRAAYFQDLFVPHLDAAYNLARFLSRDADAAQDIVQDAYLRAFNAFDGYRGGEPRAWILAIVRNCYRAWAGRSRHELANLAETAPQDDLKWGFKTINLEEIVDSNEETPEDTLARQTEIAAVRRIIETLPEPFREVLILRELEEFGYRQIAEIVESPIGTVMSRLARARRLFGAAWLRHTGEVETTK